MRHTPLIVHAVVLLSLCGACSADVYLHFPRGSNNRLNGQGVNAGNQNRLFNSQNNAKGGYNVGEGGTETFYVGSEMLVEWTAQHGCGNPNVECQIILQYMCEDKENKIYVRDGTTETTPPDGGNPGPNVGQHEQFSYYSDCKQRQRNEGLFTADRRRFYSNRFYHSQYTRQNDNGNRRGYECQEERDYYPYWQPTPWRDIAVLIDTKMEDSHCAYYQTETENIKPRGYCTKPQHNNKEACLEGRFYYPQDERQLNEVRQLEKLQASKTFQELRLAQGADDAEKKLQDLEKQITQKQNYVTTERTKRTGEWKWSNPHDTQGKTRLRCRGTDFSRDNHLGNGVSGQPVSFLWKIPDTPSDACVLRLRYNMSSTDYEAWGTWSEANGENSPIFQNMKFNVGLTGKVELAINTNQIGRTFQDRSHVFKIAKRPSNIPNRDRIINLNVRGKRGNIVQTYPAVEYDYHPNRAQICAGDWVHFQWTGSNNNPRNYAGQGTAGTDRTNIVQMGSYYDETLKSQVKPNRPNNFQMNYPMPKEHYTMLPKNNGEQDYDLIMKMALLDQTDDLLNDADPYQNFTPVQYKKAGEIFHFMCSRNNNFSNRSQKGQIEVVECKNGDLPPLHPGAHMDDLREGPVVNTNNKMAQM